MVSHSRKPVLLDLSLDTLTFDTIMRKLSEQNFHLMFYFMSCCFFLSHTLNISTAHAFRCLPDQMSILLKLKKEFTLKISPSFSIDGDDNASYPKTETWKAGHDCCDWDGVTCDMGTGHVVWLDLSNSWLEGPLRSNSSLFSLLHLQQLNLASNNFSFCLIPSKFGQLSRLTHLNLSYSRFSGNIPLEFSLLSKLVLLDLSDQNQENIGSLMINDLEKVVQNLTNLRELHLDTVDLSSSGLESLANLTSLASLSLSDCSLQGRFPKNLFLLPKIQVIDISFNGKLTGSLPYSIGKLVSSLTVLSLGVCSFSGKVPSSFGNLSQLTHLDLSFNSFTGQFSFTLENLVRLHVLDFSSNYFSGEIPSSLGNLTQLNELKLSYNNFSGGIPSSLGQLKQMTVLDLSNNRIDGIIPSSLPVIPSLRKLRVDNNQLTGSFDIHNISLSRLSFLSMSGNCLSGQISKSISKFEGLEYLDLRSNNFSGVAELGNLTELWYLDLSFNPLSAIKARTHPPKLQLVYISYCNIVEFPEFLKEQQEIEQLDLSSNKIKGQLPEWFSRVGIETLSLLNLSHNFISGWERSTLVLPWKALKYLNLESNRFQGSLFVPSLSIKFFFISENNFTGRIHPSICKSSELEVLDLSKNHFSNTIPFCLLNFSSSLQVLNLQHNNLRGKLPAEIFRDGCPLTSLDLSHNRFHGRVPRSLVTCKKLEVLNLGYNKIRDTFPFMLATLEELKVLVLRSNKFYGPIWDAQKYLSFVKLRVIDLSFNNFSGTLPSEYFQNWTSMIKETESKKSPLYMQDKSGYYHDSLTVMNKGSPMTFEKILTIFTSIDFSNNKFHGGLPDTLENLRVLIVLNLSTNSFTGRIPSTFGNLIELESLDLSNNNFSGKIPQQMTRLTFLAYLNLSQNHLTGPIPEGGQMETFSSSSFEGNSGLCGFQLSKKCESLGIPTSTYYDLKSAKSWFGFGWKEVVVGYGCGAVLGVILGYNMTPNWFLIKIRNGVRRG